MSIIVLADLGWLATCGTINYGAGSSDDKEVVEMIMRVVPVMSEIVLIEMLVIVRVVPEGIVMFRVVEKTTKNNN